MVKGTASSGKHSGKTVHIRCRRCGRKAYHVTKKRCAACGYGETAKLKKNSWNNRDIHRERTR